MARSIRTTFMGTVRFPVTPTNADMEVIETVCPSCSTQLLCKKTESGYQVWCGLEECSSIIANQGAEGLTVPEAVDRLLSKL